MARFDIASGTITTLTDVTSVTGNSSAILNNNWSSYWDGEKWVHPGNDYVQWHPATPIEPVFCIGKAHVFECDHEPKCKCGAVQRVMTPEPQPPQNIVIRKGG